MEERKKNGLDVLVKAFENFGPNGENWTTGAWFRYKPFAKKPNDLSMASGYPQNAVLAFEEGRVNVCALGSLEMATAQLGLEVYGAEYQEANDLLYANLPQRWRYQSIPSFNDNNDFSLVKRVFEKAICNALAQESKK